MSVEASPEVQAATADCRKADLAADVAELSIDRLEEPQAKFVTIVTDGYVAAREANWALGRAVESTQSIVPARVEVVQGRLSSIADIATELAKVLGDTRRCLNSGLVAGAYPVALVEFERATKGAQQVGERVAEANCLVAKVLPARDGSVCLAISGLVRAVESASSSATVVADHEPCVASQVAAEALGTARSVTDETAQIVQKIALERASTGDRLADLTTTPIDAQTDFAVAIDTITQRMEACRGFCDDISRLQESAQITARQARRLAYEIGELATGVLPTDSSVVADMVKLVDGLEALTGASQTTSQDVDTVTKRVAAIGGNVASAQQALAQVGTQNY